MALSLDFNFPCSCLCFFTLGFLGRNFIPLCLRLSFINVFRIAKFKSFLVIVVEWCNGSIINVLA